MLGLILMLAGEQAAAETTPSLDSLTISTGSAGSCALIEAASVIVDWSASNFDPSTQDYQVFRDDVLESTQDFEGYELELPGLSEGAPNGRFDTTFNYRIDIVRASDGVSLASRSASATKTYGRCS